MNDALYIAATGMQAQQLNVDTVANNLANVNTIGFKRGRVDFQELMVRGASPVAARSDTASHLPAGAMGVRVLQTSKVFTAGDPKITGAPLDVAIKGSGFFEVEMPDGSLAYSRGGSLQIDQQGYVTTREGYLLKPAIQLPPDASDIKLTDAGTVTVKLPDQREPVDVAHIELAAFANVDALQTLGEGLYRPTAQSGEPTYGKPGEQGLGKLAQGVLESSNVQLVDEMVNLMVAQRAYELSAKLVQASDEIMSLTNNLRR